MPAAVLRVLGDASALLRGAGQRQLFCPAQKGSVGRWPRVRVGSLQPAVGVVPGTTEESCETFAPAAQAFPLGGGLDRSRRRVAAVVTACSGLLTVGASGGRSCRTLRRSRWCPNGRIRPVLKHGPRSATCARVFGWETPRRNESEGRTRACCGESPLGGTSSTDPVLRCGGI